MIIDFPGLPDSDKGEDEGELTIPEIPESLYQDLFSLAYKVLELKPWHQFTDSEWFGIKDPESGEIQVVSILGAADRVFAVQVYLPEEGIRFWNHVIVEGEVDDSRVLFDLRMLECEFSAEDALPEEDVELNERFPPAGPRQGRTSFVLFRSTLPEHYPWFIERLEGEKLATALRLVPEFCKHMEEQHLRYYDEEPPKGPLCPFPEITIPIFELKAGGKSGSSRDWQIQAGTFPVAPEKTLPPVAEDDVFREKMSRLEVKPDTIWESGAIFLPTPVPSGGRLAYPSLVVTGAPNSTSPPQVTSGLPGDCRAGLFRQSFALLAQELGYLPAEIKVGSPVAEAALTYLAKQSGMKVISTATLPNLKMFMEELSSMVADQLPVDGSDPTWNPFLEDEASDLESKYRVPSSSSRYLIHIELTDSDPIIWRSFSMPIDASFLDLHCAIQDAMGWEDEHLHQFEVRKGRRPVLQIEPNVEEDGGFELFGGSRSSCEHLASVETTLEDIVKKGRRKLFYVYDFGDDWEHVVKIGKKIQRKSVNPLPEMIDGSGACPPEDCGGIWAYRRILESDGDESELWDAASIRELKEATFRPSKVTFHPPFSRNAPDWDDEDCPF